MDELNNHPEDQSNYYKKRKAVEGSSKCEHGRRRSVCKDCGGGSICEHGRTRSVCKDCGGGSICDHGRIRSLCKDCGGSGICEHGRQRSQCNDCGGSGTCEHRSEKETKDNHFDRLRQLRIEYVTRVVSNYSPSIAILIG